MWPLLDPPEVQVANRRHCLLAQLPGLATVVRCSTSRERVGERRLGQRDERSGPHVLVPLESRREVLYGVVPSTANRAEDAQVMRGRAKERGLPSRAVALLVREHDRVQLRGPVLVA